MIYIALISMTLLGSIAAVFLKKASSSGASIFGLLLDKNLYIGGFIYVAAALLNIYVLKYLPISLVLPMGGLTYIWTMFLAKFIFGEPIVKGKIIGIFLILFGAICLALG